MKIHALFSSVAITAGLLTSMLAAPMPAQAKVTFVTTPALKAQGIDARTVEIVNMSPDNKLLCCLQRMQPMRGKKAINTFYIVPVSSTHALGKARVFPVEGEGRIGNVAFTPDSQSIVFTTKEGTKLTKMDCQTGKMTTIMEHIPGQAGFVINPPVLEPNDGELLALGYHYNKEDFAGPNAIVKLDTNKTGLDAFTDARIIDHVQEGVHNLHNTPMQREMFPSLDIGFLTDFGDEQCYITAWNGELGIKEVENCRAMVDCVASASRIVYSVREKDGSYKLCVFDAKTDEKITIASGLKKPYYYVLMSYDGKTIVCCEEMGKSDLYTHYYARESEGWKLNRIEGLGKSMPFGRQRLSCDGSLMVYHNDRGLRIVELKAADEAEPAKANVKPVTIVKVDNPVKVVKTDK